jgi:hypothetical protein
MGDYDQAVADNNYFYTTWSDNRLSDAFHANQPDVRFAKIPVGGEGTDSSRAAPALISAAAAVTAPGALLSNETSWKGLAVDALFTYPARMSQATSSVPNGDTARGHTFGLTPPSLPGATDQVILPPAQVSETPTPALPRRAVHTPADDWGTDILALADLSWDGEASLPAR